MVRIFLGWVLCAQMASAQAQNIETDGNLESLAPLDCVAASDIGPNATPADLAHGMTACLTAGDGQTAFDQFILLISRGNFDAKRVADRTAAQAINVLLHQVGGSVGEAMTLMQPHQEAYLAPASPARQKLCEKQRADGPPAYHPRYMIQHGIKAVTGLEGDGMRADFDPVTQWEASLLEVARCDRP